MSSPKIAIIGAGPAGCMLGRLLHRAGITCNIFEGEANLDFRSQGGTLDLHIDTGLAAMKRAGLHDDFLKFARFDGESLVIADKNLIKFVSMGGTSEKSSRGRPEIDRPRLREILAKSLPDGMIQWGHRLRSVDSDGGLHFDHGIVGGFDLVVGGDGAWSKVRPLLTSTQPFFAGVYSYYMSIPDAKARAPEIAKLVNRGSVFAFSDGKSIIAQQMGDGSINVGAFLTAKEPPKGYGPIDAASAKQSIRSAYKGWNPTLLSMTQDHVTDKAELRPLYMLPVGERWDHRAGVTLIGDAAHLMTPFAGEGVNLAFTDSMKLADAIIAASRENNPYHAVLDRKVKEFEQDMFVRAAGFQALTRRMMDCKFRAGAPWTSIEEFILAAVEDSTPRLIFPLLSWLVYAHFFVFKLLYKPKE